MSELIDTHGDFHSSLEISYDRACAAGHQVLVAIMRS